MKHMYFYWTRMNEIKWHESSSLLFYLRRCQLHAVSSLFIRCYLNWYRWLNDKDWESEKTIWKIISFSTRPVLLDTLNPMIMEIKGETRFCILSRQWEMWQKILTTFLTIGWMDLECVDHLLLISQILCADYVRVLKLHPLYPEFNKWNKREIAQVRMKLFCGICVQHINFICTNRFSDMP